MFDNIAPQVISETGFAYEFPAMLTVDDQSVALTVTVDDHGLTLKTKKDDVSFPRSQWLDVAIVNNVLSIVVHGIGYGDWATKRKFETKNPGEEFQDFQPQAQTYLLSFKPKKLPPDITPALLNEQVRRTYLLAYLDETDNPTIIECGDCRNRLDVTCYSPDDKLFCDNCSQVMGQPDADDQGICSGCGYYTKLVQQEKSNTGEGQGVITTSRTCHRCRVRSAIWGFVGGVGAAIGIALLNFLTLWFLDRYFPALILFAGLALFYGCYQLVMAIVYSLARKAAGETPLENATNALRKGRPDEAMGIINSMDGDMKTNPGILLNLTRGLINAKDYDKASQFAETLVDKFPNFLAGHQERITARALQGGTPEELDQLLTDTITVSAQNSVRSVQRQRYLAGIEE